MLLAVLRASRTRRLAPLQLAVGACAPARPRAAVVVVRFSSTPSGSGVDGENLDQEGKQVHKTTRTWEKRVVAALKAYKEVHGDTLVPRPFVVPVGDERWPREAWDYGLGKSVSKLRHKLKAGELSDDTKSELKQLEFVEGIAQYQWENIVLPALRHFHKLHGHTDVPKPFVVPTGDASWPESTWGWKLGNTVQIIREGNYAAQVKDSEKELKELAFCYEMPIHERDWREKILPSLKVFRQEFHHCIVETAFKVPATYPWPQKAWSMSLGIVVNQIRSGKNYVGQSTRDRSTLDEIGFAWKRDLASYNELIIPSVKVYVAQYGNWKLNPKFVVPECDPWPRPAWGMRLGATLYRFKSHGSYFAIIGRDVERLEKLGYTFQLSGRAWELKVVPLLDTHESLFGDRHVPKAFVVPSEAPWPEEMWGVWLGYIVARNSRLL